MSVRSFARSYLAPDADPIVARLHGTIWEKLGSAHSLYRAVHAFGLWLAGFGISANALTYASLVISAAAGVAVGAGHFGTGALLVVASGACDALDGVVARATQTQSRFGALLDSTVDRISDALPLLGLSLYFAPSAWMMAVPLTALVGGFAISYVRARAQGLGTELPPLFMRRAERVVLLTFSLLLGSIHLGDAAAPGMYALVGIGFIGVLNSVGLVAVLRAAARALSGPSVSVSPTTTER